MGLASDIQGFVGKVTAPIDALNLAVAEATLAALQFLPKMPAARLFGDLVFHIHSHPHPPSFGIPLPGIGPILCSGAMGVLINGLPAARSGDYGLLVWCGGYFPIFEVQTGSSHVFFGGSRAARMLMDPTLHCLPDPFGSKWGIGKLDIAMGVFGIGMSALNVAVAVEKHDEAVEISEAASDGQGAADAASAAAKAAAEAIGVGVAAAQMAADAAAMAMGMLMGKDPGIGFPFGIITSGSPNVLVGGFPMPGWMTILKGLGKLLKPLIRKAQLFLYKKGYNRLADKLCPVTGHPVEIATGRMFTNEIDFEIDGRIPIFFNRKYDTSACELNQGLGYGWTHTYNLSLFENKRLKSLVLRNEENRLVCFRKLKIGEKHFHPLEKLSLERVGEFEYKLKNLINQTTFEIGELPNQNSENLAESEENSLRLLSLFDRNGNNLKFNYSQNLLAEILANDGRKVSFENQDGKLATISQHLTSGQTIRLMSFGYNLQGDLINATNRTNVPLKYFYDNHLMVRETKRSGLSFHFEYQGEGNYARCFHTWGDEKIYERWLAYYPEKSMTKVLDGLGGTSFYHFNEYDLPIKIYDALGGVSQFQYNEAGQLLSEQDEIGRTRSYNYDAFYNCVEVVQEDGSTKQVKFDDNSQPVTVFDEDGSQWNRKFDRKGNIVETTDPLNALRKYTYSSKGDIIKFEDSLGNITKLDWNEFGQISKVVRPGGSVSEFLYNSRLLLEETRNNSANLSVKYVYDDVGRIRKISELNSSGKSYGTYRYKYDNNDNLIEFSDTRGNATKYKFGGFDKVYERLDALGFRRTFKYDRDERLVRITNERGEDFKFEYDLLDRVKKEIGFDDAEKFFEYNQAGQLTKQTDALGRDIHFERDAMGRVTSRLHAKDVTKVNYSYDKCGRLIVASNEDSSVSLSYDKAWRLVSENQNGKVIEHVYDTEGNRISRKFQKSADNISLIDYKYDSDSNISQIDVAGQSVTYEHDIAGRLTNKVLPNGLHEKIAYDTNGRLSGQRVTAGGGEVVSRNYSWDESGNLSLVQDSLRGTRQYNYDAVDHLQKVERLTQESTIIERPEEKNNAVLPQDKRLWQADTSGSDRDQILEIEEFSYDGAGNLTHRKSDKKGNQNFGYKKGDKLSEKDNVKFYYDAVGNLVEKYDKTGITVFEYDGDNQLKSVAKEGRKTQFKYDAFGRRIAKSTGLNVVQFSWDGDVLLSENDTEYLHEGFVPLARIKDSQIETYLTDYLGTPKELTNSSGKIVWQGDYDEYGRVEATVNQSQQSIRFQGQFEDDETGLFYNRFRYYDADSGRYINQDPIGLNGDYNIYGYCKDPVNWIDPFGLVVCKADRKNKPKHSPDIKKWEKKGGSVEVMPDGNWKYTDWDSNEVIYKNGYPDFSTHSIKSVEITDMQGNHSSDYTSANNEVKRKGGTPIADNNTWHHHENGTSMVEVPTTIHSRFTHQGGVSKKRKRGV
jgi:RHS repeat-associated protein